MITLTAHGLPDASRGPVQIAGLRCVGGGPALEQSGATWRLRGMSDTEERITDAEGLITGLGHILGVVTNPQTSRPLLVRTTSGQRYVLTGALPVFEVDEEDDITF